MSDTPRTDKLISDWSENPVMDSRYWTDFSRELERENAELKKQIDLAIDRLYWAWSDADDDHSASAKGKIENALSILRMAAKGCKK